MSKRLEFEIEFKSDYHIGAGHGLGMQIDSALLRDSDGVPVLRGTVLEGLLRDSLVNLLGSAPLARLKNCAESGMTTEKSFCGQWAIEEPDCPVCAIFGSPRHAKRWRVSSARPVGLADPQNPQIAWRAGKTAAQKTTRVRVSPHTRRAEENKLFTCEEANSSLRFRFTVEPLVDDVAADEEAAWLVASARWLRNLGANKSRGCGECELHLVDRYQEQTLLDSFDTVLRNAPQQSTVQASKITATTRITLPTQDEDHTYRLLVLVRADEPLLIARRAEAGNQFETLEGIPGSVLRGALAWRIANRAGFNADETRSKSDAYRNFVDLFFRGAMRCSQLLPVQISERIISQGYPTIAAPRDLLTCPLHPGYQADHGHGVWSLASDATPPDRCPVCQEQKGVETKLEVVGGFLPLRSTGLTRKFRLQRTTEMHIRLHPNTRRVKTGDLFGYTLLESGQYFMGEITCSDAMTWETLRQMAGLKSNGAVNELRLGRANRRGYGKVSLLFEVASKSPWQGPALPTRVQNTNNIVLTLLSDAIVTDQWGRFERGFEATWLRRELCLPAGASVEIAFENHQQCCFSAVRSIDTFNVKLGLPRARDSALTAGSSVRLTFASISLPELQKLLEKAEYRGIGLRRDEGFGRVAFNHPIYQECSNWTDGALILGTLALGSAAQEHELAQITRFEQKWRNKLNDTLYNNRLSSCFEYPLFEAVARLEHVLSTTSRQGAIEVLKNLGKKNQLLIQPLGIREKANFFENEGEGKDGIKKIDELLGDLEKLIAEQSVGTELTIQLWRIGMEMLADRIAQSARRKAQERR